MKDEVIEFSLKEFASYIKTEKIDLGNNFMYKGLLQSFSTGAGLRLIYSIISTNKRFDTITFKVKDNDEIFLTYTINDLKKAFEKTKYKIGINSANAPILKKYFKTVVHEEEKPVKLPKEEQLPWLDEVKTKVSSDLCNYYLTELKKVKSEQKLDSLDLVIYLYYLMCNTLSYDMHYFANHEAHDEDHRDYKNLSNISLQNPNLICYEFNVIMGLIASKLGFTSSIADLIINAEKKECIVPLDPTDELKSEHYALVLSNKDYQIYFDSTRGSLDIDLLNVKTGRTIKGIKSVFPEKTNYVNYKIDKVYDIFLENHDIRKSIDYKPAINIERLFMRKDINLLLDDITIPFEQKVSIFLSVTKDIELKGMDEISYIYVLYKNIFTNNPDQVAFRIIRDNDDNPLVVMIFQEKGTTTKVEEKDYFLYEPGKGFNQITSDTLLENFFNKNYYNIDDNYDLSLASRGR